MSVGLQIKEARVQAGLSQTQLAEKAKVSRKQLSLIENGGNASFDMIVRIASALPSLRVIRAGDLQFSVGGEPIDIDAVRSAADALDTKLRELRYLLAPSAYERARDDVAQLIERLPTPASNEEDQFLRAAISMITRAPNHVPTERAQFPKTNRAAVDALGGQLVIHHPDDSQIASPVRGARRRGR